MSGERREADEQDPEVGFWAAFAGALDRIENVACDRWNAHRKYAYASIGAIIDAVRGPLAEVRISLVQEPSVRSEDGQLYVVIVTRLIHTSGYEDRSTLEIPAKEPNTQGALSAITTAKRAALLAKFAIYEVPPRDLLAALAVCRLRWRDFAAWARRIGKNDPDEWTDEERSRCAAWLLNGGHSEITPAGNRDRR